MPKRNIGETSSDHWGDLEAKRSKQVIEDDETCVDYKEKIQLIDLIRKDKMIVFDGELKKNVKKFIKARQGKFFNNLENTAPQFISCQKEFISKCTQQMMDDDAGCLDSAPQQ